VPAFSDGEFDVVANDFEQLADLLQAKREAA